MTQEQKDTLLDYAEFFSSNLTDYNEIASKADELAIYLGTVTHSNTEEETKVFSTLAQAVYLTVEKLDDLYCRVEDVAETAELAANKEFNEAIRDAIEQHLNEKQSKTKQNKEQNNEKKDS